MPSSCDLPNFENLYTISLCGNRLIHSTTRSITTSHHLNHDEISRCILPLEFVILDAVLSAVWSSEKAYERSKELLEKRVYTLSLMTVEQASQT